MIWETTSCYRYFEPFVKFICIVMSFLVDLGGTGTTRILNGSTKLIYNYNTLIKLSFPYIWSSTLSWLIVCDLRAESQNNQTCGDNCKKTNEVRDEKRGALRFRNGGQHASMCNQKVIFSVQPLPGQTPPSHHPLTADPSPEP